jgi:hypothetical protein
MTTLFILIYMAFGQMFAEVLPVPDSLAVCNKRAQEIRQNPPPKSELPDGVEFVFVGCVQSNAGMVAKNGN